jgi:choline kinase
MIETLFYSEGQFDDTVIVSYGNIIFEKSVLQKLIESDDDFFIIVDKNWKKYGKIRNENPVDCTGSLKLMIQPHNIYWAKNYGCIRNLSTVYWTNEISR